MHPAYILGAGLVTPLGIGVETNHAAMLQGTDAVRELSRFDPGDIDPVRGGQLSDADEEILRERFPDADDIALCMILQAATEALAAAPGGCRTALVLATNFGLMETLEWCWRERIETGLLDTDTFEQQQSIVDTVAGCLDIDGPQIQLSLSCASGAAAAHLGLEWLRNGRADHVLVIAYDAITQFCWTGLANMRTITTDRMRPFDENRSGTIFSEGAAAVLLSGQPEDAESAIGMLHGASTNNNAFHLTAPAKHGDGSRRAMSAALTDAGICPGDIGFISAHATSTAANDVTESAAIGNVFGADAQVPTAAFKSSLGHLLGAAGLAEMIIALHSIQSGVVPPIANLSAQDPACLVNCVTEPLAVSKDTIAVTNSAGIGGNNAATVVSAATVIKARPAPPARVTGIRLAGSGFVLPGMIGNGQKGLPAADSAFLGKNLEEFTARPLLQSVKGYLDPASEYALGAAAWCLPHGIVVDREKFGIVAATQYGAPQSGMAFFRQLLAKSPRLASPMIFPYSYANTAANLVAIEFALSGPHMVFNSVSDTSEALWFARNALRTGAATNMLVIAGEAVNAETVPDGLEVHNGAVCLWLQADPAAGDFVWNKDLEADEFGGTVKDLLGRV